MSVVEESGRIGDDDGLGGASGALELDDARPEETDPPLSDDRPLRRTIDVVVVAACSAFVFWQLHPRLLLADTTPAGGDMGAHVWAFGYLRDVLLPAGRLAGWTPDWYAGFPVFHFYMVVPFLAMVVLNAGAGGVASLVPALGSLALSARGAGVRSARALAGGAAGTGLLVLLVGLFTGFDSGLRFVLVVACVAAAVVVGRASPEPRRWWYATAAIVAALGGISFSYGASFKLVTVAGVVAMPVSSYVFGRLARFPYPTPALFSVATLAFLFDKNFTIYGGNIASTMAGEFAFSISLALAIAYLGVLVHGLRTGAHRATAAVLLALVGLCHLIPAFFALGATAVLFAVHVLGEARFRRDRTDVDASAGEVATEGADGPAVGDRRMGAARSWWLLTVGATSGLLAAFWVLPFFWRRTYLNDMGWEKIAVHTDGEGIWQWFSGEVWPALVPGDLRVFALLALVGAVLSVAFRNRIGSALVIMATVLALAFVYAPQGRLWNARLLPFWYLVVYLLAAIGVGEVVRSLAQVLAARPSRPVRPLLWGAAPVLLLVLGIHLGGQLHNLPFGRDVPAEGSSPASYELLRFLPDAVSPKVEGRNFVTDWSRWNYNGYERKDEYPEYRDIVSTMAAVGRDRGCGMSLWEYAPDLNDYGTPMALMLLPHWTDGCIGSMEGLYFEASSTTPFHFLVQSELSKEPSRAQRDMPYRELDVDAGVQHLQLMGVRYYLARSPEAIAAAGVHPELTQVAESGPWVVYEVADTPMVEALASEPVVTTAGEDQGRWLGCKEGEEPCPGVALEWFQDPSRWDVALAADGPTEWQRIDPGEVVEPVPVPPAVVDDVEVGRDGISFTVDRPGTPVLVKQSYFPNWEVSGADGPYRVAPNLMVVVPTDTEVSLTYGRTGVDLLAVLLSLAGVAAAVALARAGAVRVPPLRERDEASA